MHEKKLDTKLTKVSFYGQKGNRSRAQSFKLINWRLIRQKLKWLPNSLSQNA